MLTAFGLTAACPACSEVRHTIEEREGGQDSGGAGLDASNLFDSASSGDAAAQDTGGFIQDARADRRPGEFVYLGDASCATSSQSVALTPLDLIIALDTSYSMDFLGKWPAVKDAIKTFVSDARFDGLGVGLQYFPLRKQCAVEEYTQPAVPVDALPGVGKEIARSLDSQRMYGGTPMVPMLEGVLAYAQARARKRTDCKVVIVLTTDGIPDNSCTSSASGSLPNTLDNVVKVAEDGASGKPEISTFVIGVGKELHALDEIARAGSSTDAFLVDTSENIEGGFLKALTDIRRRVLACEHVIPTPEGDEVIDLQKVNVIFSYQGKDEIFYKVEGKDDCALSPENSWYYDDPVSPMKVVLCPETCDRVQSVTEGVFDVQFGCKTFIY